MLEQLSIDNLEKKEGNVMFEIPCTHYWECERAEGQPTSLCRCIKCNLEQYFLNYIEGEDVLRFESKPFPNRIEDILPYAGGPILSL